MRFKVVQALAARDCADVALDVLRARSAARKGPRQAAAALEEAAAALSIRLQCNLITEAFMEVAHSPRVMACLFCHCRACEAVHVK
jgi:hypothetical protein